jgi:TolB-like protein/Flp pilus assembly protein TadD
MPGPDSASPDEPRSVNVFVSYAHEDRGRAQQVVRGLEQAGFTVWWDGLIVAGAAYATKTEQALESASVVVVLWSRHSVASHWVRDEAAVGRDRSRLVPVSLDGSDPPLGFRQYLFIDLAKWHGKVEAAEFQAIVQAVRLIHGPQSAAPPPLAPPAGPWRTSRRALLIAGGGLATTAVLGGGWLAWRRSRAAGESADDNGVAVLPFGNLSGDPGQAYFSDGLAAEVRASLVRNRQLRVIAQVSSDAFRGGTTSAVGIAKALGVSYLLDGNVRRSGATFRIDAELIDGRSGFSRWSQTFDRPIDNIFAVQSEIATAVASALTSELGSARGGGRGPPPADAVAGGTASVAAFDAYLRGRALYNQADGEAEDRQALAEFEKSLAADPRFASAHAGRARSLMTIANQYADAAHTTELYAEALRAARTAAELAPDLADAQSTLAYVLFQGRLDVRGAREPYDLSRRYGEGDAPVMGRFALYCAATGRAAEAEPAMQAAVRLDPLNPLMHRALGHVQYAARRYADAIAAISRALVLNPKLPGGRAGIGDALVMLGRAREARESYLQESHRRPHLTGLAIAERQLGNEAAAREALQALIVELGDAVLYQQAQVRAQWAEREAAMSLLVRARALGDSGLVYLSTDPLLDPVRALPAFRELLSQVGFV